MHPILFAVVGFIGIMAVASALGWIFGIVLIVADMIHDHPVGTAKASLVLGAVIFTVALFIRGDCITGCLGVILLGLWLAISSERRQ